MIRKLSTTVLPAVAAVGLFVALPVEVAAAYPVSCDVAYETCMAQATTLAQHIVCYQAFEQCSGGAIPPDAVDPALSAAKNED